MHESQVLEPGRGDITSKIADGENDFANGKNKY